MTNQQNYTLIEIQTAVKNNSGRTYGTERIRQLSNKWGGAFLPTSKTYLVTNDVAKRIIEYLTHSALARNASGAKK